MPANRQLAEQGRPAGFVSRLIAITLDLAILVVIITTVTLVSQWLLATLGLGQPTKIFVGALTAAFALVLWLGYFVGLISAGGQTVGKRIMGLRVVRTDGSRVTGKTSLKRFIGYIIALPLFWGYLIVLVDNRRQAFQDHFADTFVIYFMPAEDELGPLELALQSILLKRRVRLEAQRAAIKEKEQQAAEHSAGQPSQPASPNP
jgi:uncharacterized RDD family membrane protein YckC